MKAPVLIVSTGRCGSTMISNIVNQHPRILSVSEFFASLADGALRGGTLDGEALFRKLSTLRPVGKAMLRHELRVSEYIYPLGPDSRFAPEDVPPIVGATLPHISDDPEALWDELVPAVLARGTDTLAAQYRFVFEWLARRFEKDVWIERSGASLLNVPMLAQMFPDARFVHVYRDGRDTAMSMRRHHVYRLYANSAKLLRMCGLDPFLPFNWPSTSPWMPYFSHLYFSLFSPARYKAKKLGLPLFGWLWNAMIVRGTRYLNALDQERVLNVRFESVLERPRDELSRLIEFVGPEFADADWLERASALPRKRAPSWNQLERDEHVQLAEACAPGQQILGYDNRIPDA